MFFIRIIFLVTLFCVTGAKLFAQQPQIDELSKQLKKATTDSTRLFILSQLSKAYKAVDPKMTFAYALKAKALSSRTGKFEKEADAEILMGISWGIRSNYDSALYYFNESLRHAAAIRYEIGIADAYMNIGQVYMRLDDAAKAATYYLKALPLFEHSNYPSGINLCMNNLGDIYATEKSYDIALNYYYKALQRYRLAKNSKNEATTLSDIASCYFKTNELLKALDFYAQSLRIRQNIHNPTGEADVFSGMGEVYTALKKYDQAEMLLLKAQAYFEKIGDKNSLSKIYLQIADNYWHQKKFSLAEASAFKSLLVALQIHSKITVGNTFNLLSKINCGKGDYKRAYEYQSKFLLYRDSVFSDDKLKSLSLLTLERSQKENFILDKENRLKTAQLVADRIRIEYYAAILTLCLLVILLACLLVWFLVRSNKQKRASNELLEKQKQEIYEINHELASINEELTTQMEITIAQNMELEKINEMKNKLYAVISHDFRSPLSTLKSLIHLAESGDVSSDELPEYLQKISVMIDQTFIFLENLLAWSKNQLHGLNLNAVPFDIKIAVTENIDLFRATAEIKKVEITNSLTHPIIVFADEDMIKLVIRNLLANAIKFSNSGGFIDISITKSFNEIILSIKDTGVGMRKEILEKLFHTSVTSPGTMQEKGTGLGLLMCREFIGYNKGRIWAESELGIGTIFYVAIPMMPPDNPIIVSG